MIIERNIAPYVVFAEDPILTALQKISANGQRIIFLVNESGILRGSLSDGDFRRWLIANPTASLETSALDAANANPQTAPADADKAALAGAFGFKGVLFDFLVKKAVEVILEGHPFVPGIEEGAGEACCFSVNKDAQAGWRGKGISLYMVDG